MVESPDQSGERYGTDESTASDDAQPRVAVSPGPGGFVAAAAGALEGPIADVRRAVTELLRGLDAPRRRERLADIAVASAQGGVVVAALLALARRDAGRLERVVAACDLADLCAAETGVLLRHRPGLEVALEGPAVALVGDPDLLRPLLGLLILGVGHVAERRLTLIAGLDDGSAGLAVRPVPYRRDPSSEPRWLPVGTALARALGGDLRATDDGYHITLPAVAAGS